MPHFGHWLTPAELAQLGGKATFHFAPNVMPMRFARSGHSLREATTLGAGPISALPLVDRRAERYRRL
jgi:hypothetical protein